MDIKTLTPPPKPPTIQQINTYSESFKFKLSKEMKRVLIVKAQQSGFKHISEYLRYLIKSDGFARVSEGSSVDRSHEEIRKSETSRLPSEQQIFLKDSANFRKTLQLVFEGKITLSEVKAEFKEPTFLTPEEIDVKSLQTSLNHGKKTWMYNNHNP